ncbi:oxidoreductase [Tremella mesenterica]|uniref:Oxidoreductase n=1 Tax=Tremella mesenterica TaxID=5217 RepID=A0A4Q1BGE7_TREME|nr:oxidoreductase [Tremella mesenterica]
MTITNGTSSQFSPYPIRSAKGYHTFLPEQLQPIGSLLSAEKFPQNAEPPKLFEPLTIRGVTFHNRAWVAPMCVYSSDNGHATDFHLVHLGSMALRGWGSIMVEATAVVAEGRISPSDSGIWQDSQIAPLKTIVDFVHANKGIIGIQLAHSGRKGSTMPGGTLRIMRDDGWKGGEVAPEQTGGWPSEVVAPSAISFNPGKYPDPVEASVEYLTNLKEAYVKAAERCKIIGFDFIEIHGAHGYFLHEFCSPGSNRRTDQYGGSFENRIRFPLEVAQTLRAVWDKPLFYRVSASDWLEDAEGPEKAYPGETEEYKWWGLDQTTLFTQKLADAGVDLIDVSSGGNDLRGKIAVGPSYQLPFAEHIKKNVKNILVGAVGIITEPEQAEEILENNQADVVLFARQVLRDIDFPLKAAQELGAAISPALQFERGWSHMVVKRDHRKAPAHHSGISTVEGEESIYKRKNGGPAVYSAIPS